MDEDENEQNGGEGQHTEIVCPRITIIPGGLDSHRCESSRGDGIPKGGADPVEPPPVREVEQYLR
jgi:hypothetical protein